MNNQQSQDEQPSLTARQIFEQLITGKIVKIPPDENLANQLKNHLNVLKSRHRKMFSSLGLDPISAVIKIQYIDAVQFPKEQLVPIPAKYNPNLLVGIPAHYEISLVAPKKRRTYPAFVIENNTNEPSSVK